VIRKETHVIMGRALPWGVFTKQEGENLEKEREGAWERRLRKKGNLKQRKIKRPEASQKGLKQRSREREGSPENKKKGRAKKKKQ